MNISSRWDWPLGYVNHAEQQRYLKSTARFKVVAAGRRSGKTEWLKRMAATAALSYRDVWDDPAGFLAAPVRDQAKRIFWNDMKDLLEGFISAKSETELWIELINGFKLCVVGLDRPERIEGSPWNWCGITEIANVKPHAWESNIFPVLSERGGWAVLEGVPEGENWFKDLFDNAKADTTGVWDAFHWLSSEILDVIRPGETDIARGSMDELTYLQEYEAAFVTYAGRAYPKFGEANYYTESDFEYNPKDDVHLCFDFNVSPGVCAFAQETGGPSKDQIKSYFFDEVHIPKHSTSQLVAETVIDKLKDHTGHIYIYGDATGGAQGSAKVAGSDWQIITQVLRSKWPGKVTMRVPRANPRERVRVNAVNSRICTMTGNVRLFVHKKCASHLAKDLRNVKVIEGGAGQLDKKSDPELTHISDAAGYYIAYRFPISEVRPASTIGKPIIGASHSW